MAKSIDRKLRIGVLGLGMAGALMVPHVAGHTRCVLTGAADRDARLREKFAQDFNLPTYEDASSLIESPDIDAVYIATPHQMHKDQALLAAAHGKHVVVEKPMALSLSDCDEMIAAADRHDVTLIVGHTFSFEPAIKEISRLAEHASYGPLAMLAMWNYTDFLYRPRRPEELNTDKGGGILFNQIPHQVDIARAVARSPVRSVRASTAILDSRRPTEGCCSAFIDFESGASACLVYSGYDHFDSDELHGWVGATGRKKTPKQGHARRALANLDEDAELRLRTERYGYGHPAEATEAEPEYPSHFGTLVATFKHADIRTTPAGLAIYSDESVQHVELSAKNSGRTQVLDELCDAVFLKRPPMHDGRFAIGTVEACLAIQQSARSRREVFLR